MTQTSSVQQALTFTLEGETFGVEVGLVDEIVDPQPMTRVPNADPFAPALINVRGTIVPVVDLRRRLGAEPAEATESSRMLVLNLEVGGEPIKAALTADAVHDIVEVAVEEVESVPELGVRWPVEYFRGVAKKDGALVVLLDERTSLTPRAAKAA
jgi:purine-binding chemotaxis protein CheW